MSSFFIVGIYFRYDKKTGLLTDKTRIRGDNSGYWLKF